MPRSLSVLFEDDAVVVFNKPPGLLTVPTPRQEQGTLAALAREQYQHQKIGLYPCHRLDRDTSGAILFAKGKESRQAMEDLFRKHLVKKKYLAFVRGRPRPEQGEISLPIKDFHEKRFRRGMNAPARSALTRYWVVEGHDKFSEVEVEPVTGRTNQIRIHFAKIGHPLLGERLYAFGRDFPIKFRRIALHSHELTWPHPVDGRRCHVRCELAEDMRLFLEKY
jgi:23S rRNA pseudouridine1911/1915/1917 synthase